MKSVSRQCQAVTVAGTYSLSHRCLKRSGIRKLGAFFFCAHHRSAAERARG